ncbi:MAG: YggT family protein [Halanaerobium sp. MSAO_Bac5]|nr:MAG: YggT family protein [Halanaerobium sp. MSAO_Bac5]
MYMLARIINTLFTILNYFIIARVIISWVRPNPSDQRWRKLIRLVYDITEPILGPIRQLIPTGSLGVDFSPLIALFALSVVRRFVIRLLIY